MTLLADSPVHRARVALILEAGRASRAKGSPGKCASCGKGLPKALKAARSKCPHCGKAVSTDAKVIAEALHDRGGNRKAILRLPDGTFAPAGSGKVLQPGDKLSPTSSRSIAFPSSAPPVPAKGGGVAPPPSEDLEAVHPHQQMEVVSNDPGPGGLHVRLPSGRETVLADNQIDDFGLKPAEAGDDAPAAGADVPAVGADVPAAPDAPAGGKAVSPAAVAAAAAKLKGHRLKDLGEGGKPRSVSAMGDAKLIATATHPDAEPALRARAAAEAQQRGLAVPGGAPAAAAPAAAPAAKKPGIVTGNLDFLSPQDKSAPKPKPAAPAPPKAPVAPDVDLTPELKAQLDSASPEIKAFLLDQPGTAGNVKAYLTSGGSGDGATFDAIKANIDGGTPPAPKPAAAPASAPAASSGTKTTTGQLSVGDEFQHGGKSWKATAKTSTGGTIAKSGSIVQHFKGDEAVTKGSAPATPAAEVPAPAKPKADVPKPPAAPAKPAPKAAPASPPATSGAEPAKGGKVTIDGVEHTIVGKHTPTRWKLKDASGKQKTVAHHALVKHLGGSSDAPAKAAPRADGGSSGGTVAKPPVPKAPAKAAGTTAAPKFQKLDPEKISSGSQYKKVAAAQAIIVNGEKVAEIRKIKHMEPVMNGSYQVGMKTFNTTWHVYKPGPGSGDEVPGTTAYSATEAKAKAAAWLAKQQP